MNFALSFFLLCGVAKGFTAWTHQYHWSYGTPMALLWQDAAISLCILGLAAISDRTTRLLYWALAIHLAACMPLLQVLASPLTRSLVQAASGTLRDSIAHYLRFSHLAPSLIVLILAACLPRIFHRLSAPNRFHVAAIFLGVVSLSGW